jgi:hypothetical protein
MGGRNDEATESADRAARAERKYSNSFLQSG